MDSPSGLDEAAGTRWHSRHEDAGWRGPIDYSRFAIAVEQYAATVKADIFPLTLSGEVCKSAPTGRTPGEAPQVVCAGRPCELHDGVLAAATVGQALAGCTSPSAAFTSLARRGEPGDHTAWSGMRSLLPRTQTRRDTPFDLQ